MAIIVNLKQNTPEWLEFRKNKIGGSDAPIIMGVSKWCTPWQLYMRKLGLIPQQCDNHAMVKGRFNESIALQAFNEEFRCNCIPVVMQHEKYPWMIASLDGWDEEKKIAVEIKCPGKDDHEKTSVFGEIPEHYYPQIMHQLHVLDVQFMYYWSWRDNSGSCTRKFQDQEYIKDMIEKELDFMRRLKELDPPELCEKDYVENPSRLWQFAAHAYNHAKNAKQHAEQDYEEARLELIKLSGGNNCKGGGIKLTRSVRRGSVDYSHVLDHLGFSDIDLDPYRKDNIVTWRVSEE